MHVMIYDHSILGIVEEVVEEMLLPNLGFRGIEAAEACG